MSFMDRHSLAISLLSPVHIGCGEDFDPTGYVIVNGILCAFDLADASSVLDTAARKALIEASNAPGAAAVLKTQRVFYEKRDKLAALARLRIPVGDDTVQKQYDLRIGQVAQRESAGNNVINRLEIARSSYDPLAAQPLLPGSSIKGAIRTALLNAVLAERSPNNPFATFQNQRQRITATEAQRPKDAERAYKKLGVALQPQTFGYADNQKILLERDPLRLLRIADAHYQPKEGRFPSHIVWRVNRRNSGVEGKGMATLIEALNASPASRFQAAAYRGELIVDHGTPLGQDKTPQRRFQLPDIIKACNDFYLAKLKGEVAKLEGKADPKWIAQIQEQVFSPEHNGKATMGRMIANGKGFLLRIGRHSGSEAVTVDELRRIYIRQHEKFSDAPFTRWLSAANRNQQDSCRPFGWVFVQTKKI